MYFSNVAKYVSVPELWLVIIYHLELALDFYNTNTLLFPVWEWININ